MQQRTPTMPDPSQPRSRLGRRPVASALAGLTLVLLYGGAAGQTPEKVPADHAARMAKGQELFRKHVRQILLDRCVKCHGGDKTRADLDLTTREGLLRGGDNGTAVVPYRAR